jgi:hypothetical protein
MTSKPNIVNVEAGMSRPWRERARGRPQLAAEFVLSSPIGCRHANEVSKHVLVKATTVERLFPKIAEL